MAYVPVPKDLTKVKTKVMFNLTKRQLVCFGSGALLGVPLFFLLKGPVGTSTAAMCMVILLLPFFLLAMYEKNGQPLEKILRNMIRVCFLRPRQRPYKTKNFYAVVMRQDQLDREVYHIVNGKAKTDPRERKLIEAPSPGRTRPIKSSFRRRTASLISGCSRTASAVSPIPFTPRRSSIRILTTSFRRTRIKRPSLKAGATSSTTSTAPSAFSFPSST